MLIGAFAGYHGGLMDDLLRRATEAFQAIPPFVFVIVVVVIAGRRSPRPFSPSHWCRGPPWRAWCAPSWRPIIVTASITVASAILTESALAFLGLGDAKVMSWGSMIGAGREMEWYLTTIPGIAILLTVLALNLVGEGLNDAVNPTLESELGDL